MLKRPRRIWGVVLLVLGLGLLLGATYLFLGQQEMQRSLENPELQMRVAFASSDDRALFGQVVGRMGSLFQVGIPAAAILGILALVVGVVCLARCRVQGR